MTKDEKEKFRFVCTSEGAICIGNMCNECIYNGGLYSEFGGKPTVCSIKDTYKCKTILMPKKLTIIP